MRSFYNRTVQKLSELGPTKGATKQSLVRTNVHTQIINRTLECSAETFLQQLVDLSNLRLRSNNTDIL